MALTGKAVEALLRNLPKAAEMSAKEIKKFEKFVGGLAKNDPNRTTAGMRKAPAKVQKALDRTENRIPGNTQLKASVKNNKLVVKDEYMARPLRVRGSNKSAAKANTPNRTPGVKKNKSLQRSINNSNKNLKK